MTSSSFAPNKSQDNDSFVVNNLLISEVSNFSAKDDGEAPPKEPVSEEPKVEEEIQPEINNEQLFEEAYQRGLQDAQNQYIELRKEEQGKRDALAVAIEKLHSVDEDRLAHLFWGSLKLLLVKAVGETSIDKDVLFQRCQQISNMVDEARTEYCLHLSPADVEILRSSEMDVELKPDPGLHNGSVILKKRDGHIVAGTASLLQEIEEKIQDVEVSHHAHS